VKKSLRPEQRRELVGRVRSAYDISQRRACWSLRVSRTSIRYESIRPPQDDLSMRIREITEVRTTWGSRRVHVLLLREGWQVNHKRVRRLYRLEWLNLRTKRPRRRTATVPRQLRAKASRRDERWSCLIIDFMSDQLQDGRRIRVLTIVDQYTRETVAMEVRGSFKSIDVIKVLNWRSRSHRKPSVIQVDNGSEFTSGEFDAWASRANASRDFSRQGKPTDNAFIESFNARVRAECLNANVFESLEDARNILTNWRLDYNRVRPHSALGMLTPKEFAESSQRNEVPVDQIFSR